MRNCLSEVKKDYDYIILDCMPSLGMVTINALASADSVIIPIQSQYLAAKGMTHLLKTISKVKRQINPDLKVDGALLTLVDKRTNLSKEMKVQLQENYGSLLKLFDTQIPLAIKTAESTSRGKSIFTYDKNSKVAEAYSSFAKEVVDMAKNETKMPLPKLDELFTTEEERQTANLEKVIDIPITEIEDFPNHPFRVIVNDELKEMASSIEKDGVREPALVRPIGNGKYQMISGHRRKKAVKLQTKKLCPALLEI